MSDGDKLSRRGEIGRHPPQWQCGCGSRHFLARRQRAAADQVQTQWAREDRPTRLLPVISPLTSFQGTAPGCRDEFIRQGFNLGTDLIHCLCNLVGRVARNILLQRVAKDLAPRPFCTPSQPLRCFEDIIWNRDCCFHTVSVTTNHAGIKIAKAGANTAGLRYRANSQAAATVLRVGDDQIKSAENHHQRHRLAVFA